MNSKNVNYPKEVKIAKQLIKLYPFNFLKILKEPFYPVSLPSLAWFLTKEGKKYLTFNYFEYKKEITNLTLEKEPIKLNKEKIGKDIKIENNKPKSLQEFLGMFK